MPQTFELQRHITRFKRAAQLDDIWEGAIESMPAWVNDGPDGDPFRPLAAVWVSTTKRIGHLKLLQQDLPSLFPHASVNQSRAHVSRVEGRYDHARRRLRQREQIALWHSRPHRAQTLVHRMIFLMACTSDAPHMMVVGPAS